MLVKFWLRINDQSFNDTLVGEARNVCIAMNLQPVALTTHLLELCDENINSGFVQLKNFCHYLKHELKNFYINYWKEQIQQGGNRDKLRTFKKIKTSLDPEKYIFEVNNIKHRQAVTKLRISAHRLPVEVGRYNNIPYQERICSHCDLNEVGNEQHYLMQCANTKFSVIRTNFITNLFRTNYSFRFFNNHDLFIYIMSMKDKSINSPVAKFCYDILKIFGQL